MSDLMEMVKRYTIKYDRKIKSICAPLKDCLGISYFSYFSIEADGRYIDISNDIDFESFFYSEQLSSHSPFLSHPALIRSGYLLNPSTFNPNYVKTLYKQFQIGSSFTILRHYGDAFEVAIFHLLATNINSAAVFLDHIDLLHSFVRHFKKENRCLLERMRRDGFSAKEARGDDFLKGDSSFPLSNNDPNIKRFLKLVKPLSHREQQCLELFKQGKSAQATGAVLGLSQRTVEFYFDNIKNKLGCRSKAELLEW